MMKKLFLACLISVFFIQPAIASDMFSELKNSARSKGIADALVSQRNKDEEEFLMDKANKDNLKELAALREGKKIEFDTDKEKDDFLFGESYLEKNRNGMIGYLRLNPASISHSRSIELYGLWGTPFVFDSNNSDGSRLNNFNGAVIIPFGWWLGLGLGRKWYNPLSEGALAISVGNLFYESSTSDNITPPVDPNSIKLLASYTVITLTYAKNFDIDFNYKSHLAVGVNLDFYVTYLNSAAWEDIQNNSAITSNASFSFGLDLGIIYDLFEDISIAVILNNLIQPKLSLLPGGDYSELRPLIGLSWEFARYIGFLYSLVATVA